MPDIKAEEIIFMRRRRPVHPVHHGGAWKVAYADFVTAMMSLFIVLWLTSSNESVKQSVAQYFNDPKGTAKQRPNKGGAGEFVPLAAKDIQKLREQLLSAARRMPNFENLKDQIEITAQQDGLRIELLEQPGGTFFESGSAEPTPALRQFLQVIAPELGRMQTRISIEGHTDSVPYAGRGAYTNWELSADRANSARRLISASGVQPSQIAEVRGFADQLPRHPEAPTDPSNRRITLIVNPVEDAPEALGAGASSAETKHDPEINEVAVRTKTGE